MLLVWYTREVLPLLSDGYRPPPSLLRLTCLGTRYWCSVEDSNPGCRCVGPMPLAAWRTERGSGGGIRTRTVASFEEADSADWSTPPRVGTPGAIRTRTSCGLNAVTPASWSTGAWCPPRGIEPGTCCLQGSCSAAELGGQQIDKRPRQPEHVSFRWNRNGTCSGVTRWRISLPANRCPLRRDMR